MAAKVAFHRLARADLFEIYSYIEEQAGPERAGGYLERIQAACDRLGTFPDKGAPRDDIAPGLRTLAMERRVLIAYRLDGETVEVLRVLYAGRDFRPDAIPH